MLKAENISSGYGKSIVLHGVSIDVGAAEVVTLVGLNGAGKSTLLRTLSGMRPLNTGKLTFEGADLKGKRPDEIMTLGLVQVPEGRQLFAPMSVLQNLTLGAYTLKSHAEVGRQMAYVFDLFPILRERKGQRADRMSGGEQQMLAIGRALMARPRLLLLDEPSVGLAPMMVGRIFEVINTLRKSGMSVLLVEQDISLALEHADRAYLMESGHITASGTVPEMTKNARMQNMLAEFTA
jgi:branched-chain amino acid transport system ATP-binding protein